MMGDAFQIKPILDAVWRRKWLIVLPPILGALVGWAWVQRIPEEYEATTKILVVGQRVPKEILQSTVTSGPGEIIGSLKVLILSDRYLNDVVKGIGMVPEDATPEDRPQEFEKARNELRPRVRIDVDDRRFSHFTISVMNEKRRFAKQAAERLADLFIEESKVLRKLQAEGTEGLVGNLLDERKSILKSIEDRLATFRKQHRGELPEDQASNTTLIQTYRTQIEGITDQIRQRQGEIEVMRAQLENTDAIAGLVGVPGLGGDPLTRDLQAARDELGQLLLRYSEQHPDVKRQRAELERLERELQNQISTGAGVDSDSEISPNASPAEVRIALTRREISELERKRAELQDKVDERVRMVENAPAVQAQLNEILREYDEARGSVDELRKAREDAQQGREVEESGLGEQFKIQETSAPWDPAYPNVPGWIFTGLLVGLAAGGGLAFVLEFFDPSLRSEETFRQSFPDIPLLVAIPTMPHADKSMNKKKSGRRKGKKAAAAM